MVPVGQLPEKEVKKSGRGTVTSFIEHVLGPNVTRVPLSLPWNTAGGDDNWPIKRLKGNLL